MILALTGTGLVAGFINTTAGGGSTLALPMLIFLGLPANVANGTNRVAILLQNVIGVRTFHQKKVLDFRADYRLAIPAILGSLVGAFIAVEINPDVLKNVFSQPQAIRWDGLYPVAEGLDKIQKYMHDVMEIGKIIDLDKFIDSAK